nr:hypothetical protein [uncultured Flavobacterium sp.]
MINREQIHEEVRNGIEKYFSFLKEYHFSDFAETDLGLWYHFKSSNQDSEIDICVEALSFTPLGVTINGFIVSLLEPENDFQKQYNRKGEEYYNECDQNCKAYKNNASETTEKYLLLVKQLNEEYLKEAAFILKRNENVLFGDNILLESNLKVITNELEKEDKIRKKKEKLYSCEFKFGSGIESSYEAFSLEEIKKYLKELKLDSIHDIEVYDWNMNRIDFVLDK